METVEQMKNVAQDLIASYDSRVDAIGTIMDNTYQVLDDFKDKRAKLSTQLKETLAKRGSLRKKDFDRMINGILLSQEEKEKEVKQSLRNFIKEQKKGAFELKDALTKGEVERIKKAQIGIENGIAEIKGLLKGFYEQQKELTEGLRKPLTKGNDLKIKDFKDMIKNLQTRRKEVKKMGNLNALGQDMVDSHWQRKKEIRDLLGESQKENVQRRSEVQQMMQGFRTEIADIKGDTHRLMGDIRGELKDLFAGFRKEGAERKVEVVQMMEGFRTEIAEIKVDTHKVMDDIRRELKDLFAGFQKETVERKTEVTQMMEGFHKEIAEGKKETHQFLDGMRVDLKHLMAGFRKEIDELHADVQDMWAIVRAGKAGKGGAKRRRAHSLPKISAISLAETEEAETEEAETEEEKPARRGKRKLGKKAVE